MALSILPNALLGSLRMTLWAALTGWLTPYYSFNFFAWGAPDWLALHLALHGCMSHIM
jgi:hypothetical protein